MRNFSLIMDYYSREDVQKAILEASKNREIVGIYENGNFGKRPNIIQYQDDILQMVKSGMISFHGSVERWSNPMLLRSGMLPQEQDKLRIGWDLILDPDCSDFEIGKIAVKTIVEALKDHGIKSYYIKLTGGKGFHIGIPFEAFPKTINSKPIEKLYPELPRKIILYLKDYIREQLKENILAFDDPLSIAERIKKPIGEIIDQDGLDPFKVVEIDPMMANPRHMFRLPYSLHEKTLLVSLPISLSQLDKLKRGYAYPPRVKVSKKFLTEKPKLREASSLVVEASDWFETHKKEEKKIEYLGPKRKIREIPKKYFSPCIIKTLQGLQDGRKRSLFILITYLKNMGWSWEKLEDEIMKWNSKNIPPLQENYIRTQIRWHKRQPKNILPPNCDNNNFYKSIGTCVKDNYCRNLKNPINYAFRKMKKK